jgi:hypothetical protein
VDLECDSGGLAGGLHQQINKDESRRTTRRQGVDIANPAWKANDCAQLNAFGLKRTNKCAILARATEPKRKVRSIGRAGGGLTLL